MSHKLNNKKKLKQKILNHFLKNGGKKTCESKLLKALKLIQKSKKHTHIEILKLAILNTTPIFRVIKLKEKKRKKGSKTDKEIPSFLSGYASRSSWALKYISFAAKKNKLKSNNIFYKQLGQEILTNANSEGDAIKQVQEVQKKALQKKKFFRYYRW